MFQGDHNVHQIIVSALFIVSLRNVSDELKYMFSTQNTLFRVDIGIVTGYSKDSLNNK